MLNKREKKIETRTTEDEVEFTGEFRLMLGIKPNIFALEDVQDLVEYRWL